MRERHIDICRVIVSFCAMIPTNVVRVTISSCSEKYIFLQRILRYLQSHHHTNIIDDFKYKKHNILSTSIKTKDLPDSAKVRVSHSTCLYYSSLHLFSSMPSYPCQYNDALTILVF